MAIADDLKQLDCGDVDASEKTRAAYSHDASIFEAVPQVVVYPRSAHDIGKLVRYASEHKGVWITPRAAGTDMSGGAVGRSIVLDVTRYLHALEEIARDNGRGYAIAQPGMYFRDFDKATLARGLQYPVFPASRDLCAMGGIVSNNAAGERSLKYGQTVDYVHSVRAVLADGNEYELGPLTREQVEVKIAASGFEGNLYRDIWKLTTENWKHISEHRPHVSKNSSGYYLWRVWDPEKGIFNLAKLICGSQGTLGIVTQATLGLVKPKLVRKTLVVFLDKLERVTEVTNELLRFDPESLESFDDKTLSFTLRFLPDFVRLLGAANIISLGLKFLPEAWMALTGGLPKLVLLAEFTGDTENEVMRRAEQALEAMRTRGTKVRLTKSAEESHKYWTIRRYSFNVLRKHGKGKRTTPFIDDVIVPIEKMPEFLPKLYAILEPYHLTLTIAGHAGNGNFHIIPLMDLRDENTHRVISEISEKVYSLVLEYGGSITAEHNDGLIRGPWVKKMWGPEMYGLFQQVKKIFDPKGIFNPGKKIDVDWQWALSHIRRD